MSGIYNGPDSQKLHGDGRLVRELQSEIPLAQATGSALLDRHVSELHHLGNDLEEWCEVRVRKDFVPKGAMLVEAYLTEREVIVMGFPPESDDEETGHNCDAMGCGSTGGHVLYRLPLPNHS